MKKSRYLHIPEWTDRIMKSITPEKVWVYARMEYKFLRDLYEKGK